MLIFRNIVTIIEIFLITLQVRPRYFNVFELILENVHRPISFF